MKAKRRGRPKSEGALKPWQAVVIVKMLQSRCLDQLQLSFCLWTREAITQLIVQKFDIHLSTWTVGRYLERWLQQEYPEIRERAARENALIYWGDKMGVRSDHSVGRSYGLRGQTPAFVKKYFCE